MPKKAERVALNLRKLRDESLLSRPELANELGLSVAILVTLEAGRGSPRLATLYQLALVLAWHLQRPPSEVFGALIPDDTFVQVEHIREAASERMAEKQTQAGNLRAKRQFAKRPETLVLDETPPEAVDFSRLQKLFAHSTYTKVELVDVAEVGLTRISHFFGQSAARTGNLTVGLFLRLAAALAPVYGGGVKETAFYLLGADLERLDALHLEQRSEEVT